MTRLRFLVAIGALSLLTACGDSDYNVLVDACVGEGESKQDCECIADVAKDKLSAGSFSKAADIARAGTENAQEVLENLSAAESAELIGVVFAASQTCSVSGLGGF